VSGPSAKPPQGRSAQAVALVLLSIVSIQSGAAVAIGLFDRVGPGGTVFLRNLLAIPFAFALSKVSLRDKTPTELKLVLAYGLALGIMNLAFYAALDRVPLGVGVTVEFLGPLGVAVFKGRGPLALLWAALAAAGVVAVAGPFGGSRDMLGIGLAAIAACAWAAYILIAVGVGRSFPGISGLAVGVVIASAVQAPFGIVAGGTELLAPGVLVVACVVALLSTIVPYGAEIEALRRLPPAPFGVLMSLEPAFAALIGFVALGQDLSAPEIAGIALVVIASIGAVRTSPLAAPAVN
jgi:inner membrane transporter RhtA